MLKKEKREDDHLSPRDIWPSRLDGHLTLNEHICLKLAN